MDSLTQIALGAAVGEAVLGRKLGNKAILWGAICGTVPDLDVFIPLGDAVSNFTYHRSASHSFFVLALLTPLMVWLITRLHPSTTQYKKQWAWLVYLVFATHILLDSFTVYGTQIFWPFYTTPMTWSTIFIIDPLYTLPLLVGVISALLMTRETKRGYRFNQAGLILSSLYLGWTLLAKNMVDSAIASSLQEQNISYQRFITTPTAFNSVIWRAVVRDATGYYEAYYSLLDKDNEVTFSRYESNEKLLEGIEDAWAVQRLKWFSKGFYAVKHLGSHVVISDLRMGVEPSYFFSFKVAKTGNPHSRVIKPVRVHQPIDFNRVKIVWERIWQP